MNLTNFANVKNSFVGHFTKRHLYEYCTYPRKLNIVRKNKYMEFIPFFQKILLQKLSNKNVRNDRGSQHDLSNKYCDSKENENV